MYGIFTYIFHTNQPNVVNIPYMDGLGKVIFYGKPSNKMHILSHQESKSIVQIQPETFQILSMKSYCILGTVAGFLLTFSPIWWWIFVAFYFGFISWYLEEVPNIFFPNGRIDGDKSHGIESVKSHQKNKQMGVSKKNGTPKWYHQLNSGTPWVFSNKNKQKISNLMNTTPPTPRKPSRSKLNPPLLPQARRICHCEQPLAPKTFFLLFSWVQSVSKKKLKGRFRVTEPQKSFTHKKSLDCFFDEGISQRFSLSPKV